MNPAPLTSDSGRRAGAGSLWLFLGLSLLVSLLAITNQSLWIDELLTAVKAKQPTLAGWWQAMVAEKASDLQMPLYMLYVWAFEKIFGAREWVLRAANIPWFMLGMTCFLTALSSSKRRMRATAVVAMLSPFGWYYLSEARPYAMQLGASLMIFASLHRLHHAPVLEEAQQRWWVAAFLFGIVLLCGSSLLGMIWASSALAVFALLFWPGRLASLWRASRGAWLVAGGCLVLLCAYYVWTLKYGARSSISTNTSWQTFLYIGYELLGFSGLGPGRLEIREGGLGVFRPYWPGLAIYGVVVLLVLLAALRELLRPEHRKLFLELALAVSAPAVVLLLAGAVMHFRVLGRHFTPLMPVVVFLLGSGLAILWLHRRPFGKVVVVLFCLLSCMSCLALRFASRHEKDDYRGAAAVAQSGLRRGQTVWWNVRRDGADYYQLPTTTEPGEVGKALWFVNPTAGLLAALPKPDVIVTSKPDVFDNQAAVVEYLRWNDYRPAEILPAITIWKRGRK